MALTTRCSDLSSLRLLSPAQGEACSSRWEQPSQKAWPEDRVPRPWDLQLLTPRQAPGQRFPDQGQLGPQGSVLWLQAPKEGSSFPSCASHLFNMYFLGTTVC